MIDLDAIRARDAVHSGACESPSAYRDRRALLAYVDALRTAAGKVVDDLTEACDDSDGIPYGTLGTRYVREVIADLRRLLGESHDHD